MAKPKIEEQDEEKLVTLVNEALSSTWDLEEMREDFERDFVEKFDLQQAAIRGFAITALKEAKKYVREEEKAEEGGEGGVAVGKKKDGGEGGKREEDDGFDGGPERIRGGGGIESEEEKSTTLEEAEGEGKWCGGNDKERIEGNTGVVKGVSLEPTQLYHEEGLVLL